MNRDEGGYRLSYAWDSLLATPKVQLCQIVCFGPACHDDTPKRLHHIPKNGGIHLDRYVGLSISQRDSLSTCHLELTL